PLIYTLQGGPTLPSGTLAPDGTLMFAPAPGDVGTYPFTVMVSNGAFQVSQPGTLTVTPDPVTTTRISGVIQNIGQQPLAGATIQVGTVTTTTAADGSFSLDITSQVPGVDKL